MLKILGIVIIMLSSTVLGFTLSEKFIKRVGSLEEFRRSLVILKSEIMYKRYSLDEVFLQVSIETYGIYKDFYKKIADSLASYEVNSIEEAVLNSIDTYKERLNLKDEDLKVFNDFARSLGRVDLLGQDKLLDITFDKINHQVNLAKEKCDKNLKMYRAMGPCIGAMITIFLI